RQQDRGADGGDDHGQIGAVAQRIVDAEIEDDTEQRHAEQRNDEGGPVRQTGLDRDDHQISGDHGEFALGEVHHIGGTEAQHEGERDERVDGADTDAGKEELEGEIHDKLLLEIGQVRQKTQRPPRPASGRSYSTSVVELDVLVEDDIALVVLH